MSLQSVTVTHLGALQDVASMTVGPYWPRAFYSTCTSRELHMESVHGATLAAACVHSPKCV